MKLHGMRWYLIVAILSSMLLSACGGGSTTTAMLEADGNREFSLAIDPASTIDQGSISLNVLEQGDQVELEVQAAEVIDLSELLLQISYDPNAYSPLSQSATGLLGEEQELLTLSMDREPGLLHFGAVRVNGSGAGFSGNGTVASLIFEKGPFDASRASSSPPALGNAATEIDYNNVSGQMSWFYANPGDTNQDGLVNLADLVPIARDYLAVGPFSTSSRQSVADANGDGEINISDVSVLGANWNNDAFGGFNIYTSDIDGLQGAPVGNVSFESASGDAAAQRLAYSYSVPAGSRMAFAWVQPVDGAGTAGLSGDAVFADIVITGPTASFGSKTNGGSGSSDNPFQVKAGEAMPFAVFDPEDGDITLDQGLSVWLEPAVAGTVGNGILTVSNSYNGSFVMRGSYDGESVDLLSVEKSSSGLGTGNGDGAFFDIDGCLQLHLDSPELEGQGSIWNPFKVNEVGETLDFSVSHCEIGDVTDSEHLAWGWQPENAGEFNWDHKKFTFFGHFNGLWVIEVQWEAEGMVASDHLYFIVDTEGGGTEAELELKVLEGYEDGAGLPDNPYIICDTTHEVGLKAWHSELGDVTTSEHLFWVVNPENAGEVHPEWHQINIGENFLGEFWIKIEWESAGQLLTDKKYFKVQECEPGPEFEIKVFDGIAGGDGSEEHPYEVCVNETWEFGLKAWHNEYGDVTAHEGTTWSWTPEDAGFLSPEWKQFNMGEGFTGLFSIHAVHIREGGAWEDTKHFKALVCENEGNYVEIKVFDGIEDGNGSAEHPYVICHDTHEIGVKGWHNELEDITESEHTTWIVDSPGAGVMHPEWKQFNVNQEFLGSFVIKLIYEAEGMLLDDLKHFIVIECEEEAHLALETDLLAEEGNGSQESPFKFCQGSAGEIFFEVFHSVLGEITYNEHLSWSTEPADAGEFRPDFSDFVVNSEYLGVFNVTATYSVEGQSLSKTLWFKQIECEFVEELVLIVTNPPEIGDGSELNPYVWLESPVEIGLKFLHPELGDITDNENVDWGWNPENAGEFRPQWNDFRVADEFSGGFWISASWPTEGGPQTRYVHVVIGNDL